MLSEACESQEFRNAFSSYSELSLHFVLELSRDFSLSPLVPMAGCPKCIDILAIAELPRVVFDLFFDIPVYTDIYFLSSTGADCASSGPCLTATLFTPYEVESDLH